MSVCDAISKNHVVTFQDFGWEIQQNYLLKQINDAFNFVTVSDSRLATTFSIFL